MTCRYPECPNDALPEQSRCEKHLLRWAVAKPVETPPTSPWVRRIKDGKGVAKILSGGPA